MLQGFQGLGCNVIICWVLQQPQHWPPWHPSPRDSGRADQTAPGTSSTAATARQPDPSGRLVPQGLVAPGAPHPDYSNAIAQGFQIAEKQQHIVLLGGIRIISPGRSHQGWPAAGAVTWLPASSNKNIVVVLLCKWAPTHMSGHQRAHTQTLLLRYNI